MRCSGTTLKFATDYYDASDSSISQLEDYWEHTETTNDALDNPVFNNVCFYWKSVEMVGKWRLHKHWLNAKDVCSEHRTKSQGHVIT